VDVPSADEQRAQLLHERVKEDVLVFRELAYERVDRQNTSVNRWR
jgi:hypothetical protein